MHAGSLKNCGLFGLVRRVTIPDSPTMEPNIVNVSSELYSELRGLITPWPVFCICIGLEDAGAVIPFRFLFASPGTSALDASVICVR